MEQLIGGYNRGQLLFVGDWSRGWIAAALTLALVVLLITWLDTAELNRRRRVILTTLRALTLGAAILLLLEPTLELRHVNKLKNEVAILVDSSASGALPGLGGKPPQLPPRRSAAARPSSTPRTTTTPSASSPSPPPPLRCP
jgi:hypothetical protein